MERIDLLLKLNDENTVLLERLKAIVRYVEGTNYIDRKTILLIAGLEEDEDD